MAARYWVGGHPTNNNWNQTGSGDTNWAATSGGASGASVPTSTDDVFFDANGNNTSTISATITIRSLTIDAGYTSTITHNAVLSLGTGGWTMHSGFTIAGSSGITLTASLTIISGGKTWPNGLTSNTSNKTITISTDNFIVGGTFTSSINGAVIINKVGSETFSCTGLSLSTNGSISGTAGIILLGGTWSSASSSGDIRTTLNLAGNITVSGAVYLGLNSVLNYVSGVITTTGSNLLFGTTSASTLNTNGVTWNTVTLNVANIALTITSNLTCTTLVFSSANGSIAQTGSSEVRTTNLTMTNDSSNANAPIYLGTGTWSGVGVVKFNLYLDGSSTVSGSVSFGHSSATLTYVSGTITTTSSTLNLVATTTLDTAGVSWNTVSTSATSGFTYTINSLLTANTISLNNSAAITFDGAAGFICSTLSSAATSASTVTLSYLRTYTMTTALSCNSSRVGSILTFISSHATVKTTLTLQNGATCALLANMTRIDASGGRPLRSFNGTITDCINVESFHDLLTVAA